MKLHPMRGLSLTVAVGKWAKPHIRVADYTARLCLGFVAITFYTLDIEEFIEWQMKRTKSQNLTPGDSK